MPRHALVLVGEHLRALQPMRTLREQAVVARVHGEGAIRQRNATSPPALRSARRKVIGNPAGSRRTARWSGVVHVSNTLSIGASKLRMITRIFDADCRLSRNSARRSHVAFGWPCGNQALVARRRHYASRRVAINGRRIEFARQSPDAASRFAAQAFLALPLVSRQLSPAARARRQASCCANFMFRGFVSSGRSGKPPTLAGCRSHDW